LFELGGPALLLVCARLGGWIDRGGLGALTPTPA
jgi:hypothetical protein